jgi:hypothetical protein
VSRPAADPEGREELARRLRGRTQTMLTYAELAADAHPLAALLEEIAEALGPESPLALLVEYRLEELRSRTRSVAESARVWDDLHARADASLDPRDTTLMSIKALHARFARLSGGPTDRDTAVQSYEVEWRRRLAILGARAHQTSTAHANLATALRERGGADDLRRACLIARREIAVRLDAWGEDHAFTWIAQAILAQCLLKAAERAEPWPAVAGPGHHGDDGLRAEPERTPDAAGARAPAGRAGGEANDYPPVAGDDLARPRADLVAEGRALAEHLVAARLARFGPGSVATLRAQLVRAQGLLLAGAPHAAVGEIRYVLATNRRVGANLDPGLPELLLARALLAAGLADDADDLDEAVRQARAAVEARLDRYPAGTERVTEAERFEAEARRLANLASREV